MVISSDPFTERLKFRQSQQIPQEEEISPTMQDPFASRLKQRPSQYEREKEMIWDQGEDIERQQEKGIAKATSRVLETALGTPGNIQSAIKGITGLQLGTQLPTSSDIKKFSEKATKGYTKPESEFEEKGGEILQDITALAMPGAASYSIARNIGIPIAGFLTKEGLEKTGASESSANTAKLALMFGLDLASAFRSVGKGGAKNYAKELWNESEKAVPEGASTEAVSMHKNLDKLENSLKSGGTSPKTQQALKKIDEIKGMIEGDQIPIKQLIDARKRINDIIDAGGGFEFGTPSSIKQGSINNLNQVKNVVVDTLKDYGKKNPEFGIPYSQANEAYSVYHASNAASRWLKRHFSDYIKSPLFSGLFGAVLKAGAAAFAPWQAGKLVYRVYKSPVLSELYGNVIKAAINNDSVAAAQNLQRLKQELSKEKSNEETIQSKRKK